MNRVVGDFLITKNANGVPIWIAVHTNKFLDDDIPPDILSEKAHKTFINKVMSGELPMPELWVWHLPVKIGEAKALAWHSAGFVVSMGTFVSDTWAKALAKSRVRLGMSHGMTVKQRDAREPHVILEYVTSEISVLPLDAAANKLTGFSVGTGELRKMIDPKQREQMVAMVGEEHVAMIESALDGVGEKALADGRLFKQVSQWDGGDEPEDKTVEDSDVKDDAVASDDGVEVEATAAPVVEGSEPKADPEMTDEEPEGEEPKADPEATDEEPEDEEPKADPEMVDDDPEDDGEPANSPTPDVQATLSVLQSELAAVSQALVQMADMVSAALADVKEEQVKMAARLAEVSAGREAELSAQRTETVSGALKKFAARVGNTAKSAVGDPAAVAEPELIEGSGPVIASDTSGSKNGLFIESWMGR